MGRMQAKAIARTRTPSSIRLPRVVGVYTTHGYLVLVSRRIFVWQGGTLRHAGLDEARSFKACKRRGHTLELVAERFHGATLGGQAIAARCVEPGHRRDPHEYFKNQLLEKPPAATCVHEVLLDHQEVLDYGLFADSG